MRFLKGLFVFFMLAIIIGGVVFIGYSIITGNMFGSGMNMAIDNNTNTTQNTTGSSNMDMSNENSSTNNSNQSASLPNPLIVQNREKMGEAIDFINEALKLITIDPYSNTTVPDSSMQMNNTQGQTAQGTGTINIYPSGNSSVNVIPDGNTTGTNGSQVIVGTETTNMVNTTVNYNHVYDQMKLQQLHNGIYTIAQGILAINELNDNLLTQSMTLEQQPYTYQTYVNRYNIALQNQADLKKAMTLLDNASILININPYASDAGYSYNNNSMKQLHEGIFKFAQGMAVLQSLNKEFINQMSSASMNAQNLVYNMGNMDMSGTGSSLFGNISMSTIINIVLIVLIIGLIIGVLGAIANIFKRKPQANTEETERRS